MPDQDEALALDAEAWEHRAAECRKAVGRLAWLVGRWRGDAVQAGEPRVCEVETRLLFDETFVESRERIFTGTGELEHEDVTIYGAMPEQGPEAFSATAFMRGGLVVSYRVTVSGETITCDPEGLGARLSISRTADGYRVRIFYPDENGAWVEDAVIAYSPRP